MDLSRSSTSSFDGGPESVNSVAGLGTEQTQTVSLGDLRRFILTGSLTEAQEDPLPGFPLEINRPNIYYMYAGQYP